MIAAPDQDREGKEGVGMEQGSHFKALWFNLLPRLGLPMTQTLSHCGPNVNCPPSNPIPLDKSIKIPCKFPSLP
jgi:hypothetical protein